MLTFIWLSWLPYMKSPLLSNSFYRQEPATPSVLSSPRPHSMWVAEQNWNLGSGALAQTLCSSSGLSWVDRGAGVLVPGLWGLLLPAAEPAAAPGTVPPWCPSTGAVRRGEVTALCEQERAPATSRPALWAAGGWLFRGTDQGENKLILDGSLSLVVLATLVEEFPFPIRLRLAPLLKINWLCKCCPISGFLLCHSSIYLYLCQYHTILIAVSLE